MTDLNLLESRLQGLERQMHLVGHLRLGLGAGAVVAVTPVGARRTMTRAARRHRSWYYARRAQGRHLRHAHPDGAVDCVCERSVWCFEKRKISQHRHHGWMCHPKDGERLVQPRLKRFTRRYGMWPPRWCFHLNGRG
jgi:hypothetical protein